MTSLSHFSFSSELSPVMELNCSAPPVNLSVSEKDQEVSGWTKTNSSDPRPCRGHSLWCCSSQSVQKNRHVLEPQHIFELNTLTIDQHLRVLSDQGDQPPGHHLADRLRAVLHPVVHLLLQDQHLRRKCDVSGRVRHSISKRCPRYDKYILFMHGEPQPSLSHKNTEKCPK